ncbi:MAG: TatD family hydrolase [Candidatus Omnitrophota bacterium]
MQLVDTHCHLDLSDYKDDLDEVLGRARRDGVVRLIVPGISISSSQKAIELSQKYPEIYAACGIHPHEADKVADGDIDLLKTLAESRDKVVAIGEIGLDYYRKFSSKENQKTLFKNVLKIAKELDLAVILHNRDAGEDFVNILKNSGPGLKGVVHCFSGDKAMLNEILEMGMYVSFAGSITFEKADEARALAKQVPPEKLLLETDSPYITPRPFRGRRNEPAYVKYLTEVYKDLYGLTARDIARITTHNANDLFNLGLEKMSAITYAIRDSLYVNLTNRCTNRCTFCARQTSDYIKGHNLKIDSEPTAQEIIKAIGDVSHYKEIVFCGYGEPTLRIKTVKEIASHIKKEGGRTRLTTNGEGNLINSRDITGELKGLIDSVAVSLNAPNSIEYNKLCDPVYGEKTYASILEFIRGCKRSGIDVEITCLDIIGEDGVKKCRDIAESMGASFRMRKMGFAG